MLRVDQRELFGTVLPEQFSDCCRVTGAGFLRQHRPHLLQRGRGLGLRLPGRGAAELTSQPVGHIINSGSSIVQFLDGIAISASFDIVISSFLGLLLGVEGSELLRQTCGDM